jgi:hypothetical protein
VLALSGIVELQQTSHFPLELLNPTRTMQIIFRGNIPGGSSGDATLSAEGG